MLGDLLMCSCCWVVVLIWFVNVVIRWLIDLLICGWLFDDLVSPCWLVFWLDLLMLLIWGFVEFMTWVVYFLIEDSLIVDFVDLLIGGLMWIVLICWCVDLIRECCWLDDLFICFFVEMLICWFVLMCWLLVWWVSVVDLLTCCFATLVLLISYFVDL